MTTKHPRRIHIALAVIFICFNSRSSFSADKTSAGDKAAIVNGAVITKKKVNYEVSQLRQRFARAGRQLRGTQFSKIKKDLLETLIGRELLFQESRKDNIRIKESEIAKYLKTMKSRFLGEAGYKQALQKMNISEDQLRSTIRKEMAVNQFIVKNIASKILVSGKETKDYYQRNPKDFIRPEQVKASHILIKVDSNATEAQNKNARMQLEMIQKRIKAGEDFGALAPVHSHGPSRNKRGDLGYFARRNMVKPFADAAFATRPGEVSPVVETRFGYHLIKVFDNRPEGKVEYEEARSRIEQLLKRDIVRKKVNKLVGRLKKKAVAERFL